MNIRYRGVTPIPNFIYTSSIPQIAGFLYYIFSFYAHFTPTIMIFLRPPRFDGRKPHIILGG